MNNYDIISAIKLLISSRLKGTALTYEFFDVNKEAILTTLRIVLPETTELDGVTLNNYYTTAKNEFLSINAIDVNPASSLVKNGHKVWLTEERRKSMQRDYTERYLAFLRLKGRAEKVVDEINKSSEEILEKLGDPRSTTKFYSKGLVVGNVQSGKTGNFNAVINKAIDAGYSLIIVLSGIMEDLRSQTQERIEEDVVGEGVIDRDRDKKGEKGVGLVRRFGERGDTTVRQVISITSYKSDFKKSVKESDFSLNNKNILVCKKNTGVLKNLLIWLNDYLSENREQHDIPLLIIDDEADNASLNNLGFKGREYSSTINGHIRALLNLFSRKTYLGYTATPFANVLQDRNEPAEGKWRITYKLNGVPVEKEFDQVDNIFPDDFLELLVPPSNYIGAKQIFETVLEENVRKIPLVVQVTDTDEAFPTRLITLDDGTERAATKIEIEKEHTRSATRGDLFPLALPDSLKEAVQCFILSIAVRLSRKPAMVNSRLYNPHHTMLIHVSRFIPWQNRTKALILEYVTSLTESIGNDFPESMNSIHKILERTWDRYYAAIVTDIRSYLPQGYVDEYLTAIRFTDIKSLITEAVKGIEVKAVNSDAKDKLSYSVDSGGNGKKFIAVGGNRLSRGFTLEGLTINYFIRNTNFSDTLLQMGRWFGYRPGFLDCCKLFTTSDAIEKFDSTTRTIEELETEFVKMGRLGKTPQDFILRVRKDPGTLKITRPAILKNTNEVKWSYQDKLVQTTKFRLDTEKIERSWNGFKSFIKKYEHKFRGNDDFFVLKGGYDMLEELLSVENTFHDKDFSLTPIRKFIEKAINVNKLINWSIAIKATGRARKVEVLRSQSDFPLKPLSMTIRSGPGKDKTNSGIFNKYRHDFINEGIFSVSGGSANIISGGADLSVLLTDKEKIDAKEEFRKEKIEALMRKEKISVEEAKEKVKVPDTFPERIYREKMSDQDGLLLVYLLDLKYVFLDGQDGNEDIKQMAEKFNLDIPLVGYAFGFPPIDPDPGETYVVGRYDLDEDEDEEFDEELVNEESQL
ncbi:Z1 domain-containing protein [Chitinophaga sp. 22321]|uniref:Z1 domain-containing protein n=1 Tax=Chitinophaga hostae TaxID=2831022 RepID=A0ABS5ISZ9_9BACT|nr:Z1 domain-containing protein [Chitinophaga hostae]MBS0026059.1 Z1 domain-containing protein [Chitinophaga hostae]